MSNWNKERYQEIANRGLQDKLSPERRARFDEGVSRGLITIPQQEKGLFDRAKEFVTGSDMQTRATEELGELETQGGFLSGIGDATTNAKLAATLSVTSDPNERAKILKEAYPDQIGIQYDEKGNVIAGIQGTDKRVLLNKPGLSASDIFPAAQQTLLSIPAALTGGSLGAGAKVAQAAAQQGLVTSGIEGLQKTQGGDFDATNVIVDMISAGAAEAIPLYLKSLKDKSAAMASDSQQAAIDAEAGRISSELSQEAQTARISEQLGKQSQKGSPNMREIAGEVMPDEEVIKAAERIGVDRDLTPGMVSKSDIYKDIEGALRAKGGSELSRQANEAILNVSQKADDLINEFGGVSDKAMLSQEIKDTTAKTISDLGNQSDKAYREVESLVPPTQKVDMSDVYVELQNQADNLGGSQFLEPFEKRLLKISESEPSYALIDKERKKIGAALQKKQGAYKDMDSGRLKRMYGILSDAQGKGLSDEALNAWNVAKGLTKQRKELEDQSIEMFGKDLSGALMPKVGGALKNLQRGDFQKFDKLMNAIPDKDMREKVMVSALNDVFTQGSRKEKQLNIPGFVDWYASVQRQPALMNRINDNLPNGASERLKDLFTVTNAIRKANEKVVKTGIASETLSGIDKAETMISKIYNVGRQAIAAEGVSSSFGAPGVGAASVIASSLSRGAKEPAIVAADKLVSSPEFKRLAIDLARNNFRANQATKAAESALKKSARYKAWYELLPSNDKNKIIRGGLAAYLGEDQE